MTLSDAEDTSFVERLVEREHVPPDKEFRISTRENSEYKWQANKHVIGALEIDSEPDLNLRQPYSELVRHEAHMKNAATTTTAINRSAKFKEAQRVYNEEFHLHESFIEAAEGFPVQMACCGLIRNDEKTIRLMTPYLNKTWVPAANEKLKSKGFKVDCYVWKWSHISGQSESHVLLIRFYEIPEPSNS